ncbi:restriction endonuclease subunit S [Bacteroides fragilis]|uniref:restriction endonuclease subunit S n=1 Tax=Bacteroides fragilis TaxID=817 RepID=UPI001CDC149B|nr:restriction endonuclease subunit S [Bacteroides fragilis]MCA4590568.1 restriction endonuclease subunit S [Bacteroides fragilis]MCA4626053.1 restriction endonuclease subunit S [Bacteroides fragilis]MCZ2517137.1 restriction endonuclease subunit S [Bacteroides fragilis]
MRKYKLGDIATVEISGVDKKIKDGEKEIRLCNFVDVYYNWAITTAQHDSFMLATARPNEISKFKLKKGQVALTKDSETRDDIGIPTYIADDFDDAILGYHCALVTPNKDILDGRYLNALLHTDYAKKYFACNASGSGQRYALSVEALNSFPVPIIPLHEQKQIGEIFSALDKKIELNKRINQNLEAMAKQLYDYWFVQFDYPDENGKPYKSSGGKMVWNEKLKREIPVDWEVLPLFDAVSVQYGFPFATEQFTEEETNVPVVRIRDILAGTTSAYSLEKADEKFHLNENDVLVGMDGNFHMNFWHDNIAYLNQRCVRLRAHSDSTISSIQILHSIKPYIKAKEQNAKGSTVGHLSDKDLKGLYLIKPLKTRAFNPRKTLDGLLALVIENKKQILSLTKQRDELLPLLMNCQVSVNSDLLLD